MTKTNEYYKNIFRFKEYKHQNNDIKLYSLDICKERIIERSLHDITKLINNRLSKGKIVTEEERNKLINDHQNEFLEMFEIIKSSKK
jgi:hypothetical protein